WLIEDLIHVGRAGDALDLATNMVELPRHPRYNIIEKEGSARYGTNRLMDVLADFELHEQTIALCSGAHLPPLDDFEMELRRLRLLGAAHFEMGDIEAGDAIISELSTRLEVAE